MGISTGTKDFPEICMTMLMEGFFFFLSGAKSNDGLECALHIDALGLALPSLAPLDLTEEDVELSAPSVYCMRRARTTRDEHPGKC